MQAAKVDKNQAAIVAIFRQMGCTVAHLHSVGKGIPDLLIGCRGKNLLVECKIKTGVLNELQKAWHESWKGQALVCYGVEQAADIVFEVWNDTGYLPHAPDQTKLNYSTKMIQALVLRRTKRNGEKK